jgi:hypothetical protein
LLLDWEQVEGWMTLAEAARRYGVKRDRLRRAALDGRLAVERVMAEHETRPALYLVQPADVERFLRESKPGPKPGPKPRRADASPDPVRTTHT